jgi:hypothetical protein
MKTACRCSERLSKIEHLLAEVLMRLDRQATAARAVDLALVAAIAAIAGVASFSSSEIWTAATVDVELKQALRHADVDSPVQLGHTLARLARTGLLETVKRRRDGRRWKVSVVSDVRHNAHTAIR